jgi:hypothetical protein
MYVSPFLLLKSFAERILKPFERISVYPVVVSSAPELFGDNW